ncbi:hypothetical protein QBC45DRAFT_335613, partial [Copromyces sp. CBS 386.78]
LYACAIHGPTSVDKEEHISHLEEDIASTVKQYKCGRCGNTTDVRATHAQHLDIQNPCVEMFQPTMYECKYHGPTSLDKEEHLDHFEHCPRRWSVNQ